jgi:hypothetical protein
MEGGLGLVGRSYTGVRSQAILFLSPRRRQPVRLRQKIASTRRHSVSPYNFKAARIVTLRRPAVVDFDDADASSIPLSGEQRGVLARPERYRYARLLCVCWGESRDG